MSPLRLLLFLLPSTLVTALYAPRYGIVEVPEGLSPRYYLGAVPLSIEKRQSGTCKAGLHACLDVGASGCCQDTEYCYINPHNDLKCCAIGSNCDSFCASTQYQCLKPARINGTATSTASCCDRTCPSTSAFLCASSLGGQCCSYGSVCGSNSACIPTATSSTSALVQEIVPGCTTAQISCAASLGGGCCNDGLVCTIVDATYYCASPSGGEQAVRTGADGSMWDDNKGSSGLSTGAKAGIGVGVAIGVCLFLAAMLWFFMVRRRRAQVLKAASSKGATSEVSGSKVSRPAARQTDYFGPHPVVGPYTEDPNSPGPSSPGYDRGVPISPQGPGDITGAVEIDSRGLATNNSISPLSSHPVSPGIMEHLKARTPSPPPTELP
ncbi:hypothetical protein F5884DRAFT_352049 [Xylogone sp. PMI_703]|nr:hypothetical protein F5884DRAFT_352049 [Xylogone sp. PMI_703]